MAKMPIILAEEIIDITQEDPTANPLFIFSISALSIRRVSKQYSVRYYAGIRFITVRLNCLERVLK